MTVLNIHDYYAGDSLVLDVTVKSSVGAAYDLTGATARWGVAPQTLRTLGAAITTKTIGTGITVLSAVGGRMQIVVDAGDVPDPGDYHHELEITLANGESYTPLFGTIKAKRALFTNS